MCSDDLLYFNLGAFCLEHSEYWTQTALFWEANWTMILNPFNSLRKYPHVQYT